MPPFATRPGVTAPRRGASSAIVVVPLPASSSSSSSSSPSLWDVSEDVCTVLVEDEIMPEPVKFLGGRVKADYNVRMSWDFEANLFNLPPEGIKVKQEQLGSVPLRGDWCFSLSSKYAQPRILVEHGRLAYAAHGERVTVTGELAYFADGKLHVIGTTPWLASEPGPGRNAEGTAYGSYPFTLSDAETAALPPAVQSSVQKYRFTITCTQEPEKDVARLYRTPTLDSAKALQLASLSHSPIMDVRLLFKQIDNRELELWTTADFLGKASEYYKALFASGSAETVTRSRSKRARGPSVTSEQKPLAQAANSDPSVDWQDSDDETDAFLVEHDWMSCTTSKQDTAELEYQQIEVRETAYSTMCAVLLYLQSGHIKFAPTRSSHALSPDELVTKRKAALVEALEEHPTLPPPVSPKSVYRLAHLLDREELQKMALDSLTSSLTFSGAARELFSPVSLAHNKLRQVVLEFVVKNWKEVKATEGWQAVRAEIASGQLEGGAQILLDLFAAIDQT
ncbi:hypothetical protein JCM8115_001058 [Rhodotorula mucilaginosa]